MKDLLDSDRDDGSDGICDGSTDDSDDCVDSDDCADSDDSKTIKPQQQYNKMIQPSGIITILNQMLGPPLLSS